MNLHDDILDVYVLPNSQIDHSMISLDIKKNRKPINGHPVFLNAIEFSMSSRTIEKRNKQREDMMNMLTDPKTGEELYVDLAMAEKYNFDDKHVYSIEHGKSIKISTRFEHDKEENLVYMTSRIIHKTQELAQDRFPITQEKMQEILYDVIYTQNEYDILLNAYLKEVYDASLNKLIAGRPMFLENMKTLKGIGLSYDNQNTIINFFNTVDVSPKEAIVKKDDNKCIINVNDFNQSNLHCIFYTAEFPGKFILFTESRKAQFADIDTLPATIKEALPIMEMPESLEKAVNLKVNRQYFYDTIINPIREVSRKESIASQFADIDFDF